MRQLCKKRIKQQWADSRSKAAARPILESPTCWPIQDMFRYYLAGARAAGLSVDDVVRQFKAEWVAAAILQICRNFDLRNRSGANPLGRWQPESPQRIAQRARAHKNGKMEVLRAIAKKQPGAIPVDATGEPIWRDETHGEFVVRATRVEKATGQEVGDVR